MPSALLNVFLDEIRDARYTSVQRRAEELLTSFQLGICRALRYFKASSLVMIALYFRPAVTTPDRPRTSTTPAPPLLCALFQSSDAQARRAPRTTGAALPL